MADMEAEMEFLKSMQAMTEEAGNYEAHAGVGADQKLPLSTEDNHDLQPVIDLSPTAHADEVESSVHLLSSSSAALSSAETMLPGMTVLSSASGVLEGERNPEARAVSNAAVQSPSQSSTTEMSNKAQAAGKPHSLAGVMVKVEQGVALADTSAAASPVNGSGSISSVSLQALSGSPNPQTPAQAVPLLDPTSRRISEALRVDMAEKGAIVPSPLLQAPTVSAEDSVPLQSQERLAHPPVAVPPSAADAEAQSVAGSKTRLPHDRVGILEDRIRNDARGDLDAWLSLIAEHRKRNKIQDARNVYERFFKVFPMAAEQWLAYANMELANNDFFRVEQIFNKSLLNIPHLQLWSLYLDYVRRRNNLTTDAAGAARTIVSQAYDFVLKNVGIDKDAGRIWQDYIQFIRAGPGTIGGSSWQDQQKMDQMRKAYQRAICIPTAAVNMLWKEYDSFEMGLNKITGRKFLQEKSPAYMTARSSNTELDNITRGLHRTTLPKLPPAVGCDGDDEYLRQVELWRKWIQWEKDDPLVLKDEDAAAYQARVIHAFKQAVMALRFWPEMWFEASEFCFANGLDKEGNDFLTQGLAANPESCLLAFKRADRIESTLPVDESEEGLKRRGAAVREPYDKVLDALYDLIAKTRAREAEEVARIEESSVKQRHESPQPSSRKAFEDEDENEDESHVGEAAKQAQIKMVQEASAVQLQLLSRTISFCWIALMRAMRRIQGKGKINDAIGGSRQVFTDARKRGRLTSDVYVASALIEYHCYKDPAATKIFERGMKLFPDDESFALEYLKHLIAINDVTNARAVFETTVSRLGQKPETLQQAKAIYAFFHEYEARYGELTQISKLEKRMADLFPEDPTLSHFGRRFESNGFDPVTVRPIISPATQTRPKGAPSTEPSSTTQSTPPKRVIEMQHAYSPKRHLNADDSDHETNRPRKLARSDSPLKGAAGRRLDQQKRTQQQHHHAPTIHHSGFTHPLPPPPLPRDVLFLLSIIPRADTYPPVTRFKPEEIVRLLRESKLPAAPQPPLRPPPMPMQHSHMQGLYPFPR